jgi:hypothetical protein
VPLIVDEGHEIMTAFERDFYLRVLLGSPFPKKEQNDEDVPPAPRSNGNWGPGDRGRRQRSVTASLSRSMENTIGVIVPLIWSAAQHREKEYGR